MNFYRFALAVLVIGSIPPAVSAQERSGSRPAKGEEAVKPDPAATKLMSDTHASWAHWENFPGFTAELEVNLDGKISKGKVEVSPDGKVKIDRPNSPDRTFATEILSSIVGHRLGQRLPLDAACVFVDQNTAHPLGRAIRVLGDDPGTSYRVRDREVTEINRVIGDVRYTHTILENRLNKDAKYLTTSFVANMWDAKTGALRRADANRQTWERVGNFDLPLAVTRITTTGDNQQQVGTLKLSNFKLGAISPPNPGAREPD